jgi:hypothetical protein
MPFLAKRFYVALCDCLSASSSAACFHNCLAICSFKPLSWDANMRFISRCIACLADWAAFSSILLFCISSMRSLLVSFPCLSSSDG